MQPPVPLTCDGVVATSPDPALPTSLSGAFSRPCPPAGSRADVVRPSTAPSLRVQLSAPSQCAPLEASCPHLYMAVRTRCGFWRAGHHQQHSHRTYMQAASAARSSEASVRDQAPSRRPRAAWTNHRSVQLPQTARCSLSLPRCNLHVCSPRPGCAWVPDHQIQNVFLDEFLSR